MNELKVELLKIGKEKGDNGDTDLQKVWINNFLEALLQFLTEEAILSFTPYDIRALYIVWIQKYLGTGSLTASSDLILRHIDLSMEPRSALAPKPSGENVASIFKRNT